jgi:NADH dehydrogenase
VRPHAGTRPRRVLLLGGSGFVGRALCAQLAAAGVVAVVPTRSRERAKALAVLPSVELIEADIHDGATLERLLAGCDAAINLVGILQGKPAAGARYGPAFARAHVELPRKLVAACKARGVRRLLQMSALGADAQGPSMYARSKADGEQQVRASGLDWTIFRPSVIFGAEDRFLNQFAQLQGLLPVLPLAGTGCRFQPVAVEDVARAFVHALGEPASIGQTYELVGPDVATLGELARFAGQVAGHAGWVLPLPMALGRLQAALLGLVWMVLPGEPPLSADNLDSLTVDNVASGKLPGLADLGITPRRLAASAPAYLNPQAAAPARLDLWRRAVRR